MHVAERRLEIVRDVLVELGVLLVCDVPLGSRPQRRAFVDLLLFAGQLHTFRFLVPGLLVHEDGHLDVVGVAAQYLAQLPAGEEFVFALFQMQSDFSPARGLANGLDAELAAAVRHPLDALFGGQAGAARTHRHPIGDDERRVKADAELTDQAGVLLGIPGELGEELARAGLGDCPQVLDGLLAAHADAVVDDGDGARSLVKGDADLQVGVGFKQTRVRQ